MAGNKGFDAVSFPLPRSPAGWPLACSGLPTETASWTSAEVERSITQATPGDGAPASPLPGRRMICLPAPPAASRRTCAWRPSSGASPSSSCAWSCFIFTNPNRQEPVHPLRLAGTGVARRPDLDRDPRRAVGDLAGRLLVSGLPADPRRQRQRHQPRRPSVPAAPGAGPAAVRRHLASVHQRAAAGHDLRRAGCWDCLLDAGLPADPTGGAPADHLVPGPGHGPLVRGRP